MNNVFQTTLRQTCQRVGTFTSLSIHINLEASVELYHMVKLIFYPNISLHCKTNLYGESHLRAAQTESHQIYHNSFQFTDNFQSTDLYLKSHLLQYPVELETEESIFLIPENNMGHADIWRSGKKNYHKPL